MKKNTEIRDIQHLYKYRAFNQYTLSMLCESQVYFADPSSFNDPLDCSPNLIKNLENLDLEHLAYILLKKCRGEENAKKQIRHNRYMSTEYGDRNSDKAAISAYGQYLMYDIKGCLDKLIKGRGIYSLSQHWNSPLMWSHYADEHRGVCIEYDISRSSKDILKSVAYDNVRSISVSQVYDWIINKNTSAEIEIRDLYFFSKAPDWAYEKEWRLILAKQGLRERPYGISGIYFGMKCDVSVQAAIIKLIGTDAGVQFYHVGTSQESYDLERFDANAEECEAMFPRGTGSEIFGGEPYTDDLRVSLISDTVTNYVIEKPEKP